MYEDKQEEIFSAERSTNPLKLLLIVCREDILVGLVAKILLRDSSLVIVSRALSNFILYDNTSIFNVSTSFRSISSLVSLNLHVCSCLILDCFTLKDLIQKLHLYISISKIIPLSF